jgi:hypothetical protein
MSNKIATKSLLELPPPQSGDANRRKVIAHDVVNVRPARSRDSPPMIVTIPKELVEAMKLKKGEELRIYTDGEKLYLDRFERPTLNYN